MTEADKAAAIRDAANELYMSLHLNGNQWTRSTFTKLLGVCDAVIAMVDDGDCMAERAKLLFELGCGIPADNFWRESQHAIDAGLGQ